MHFTEESINILTKMFDFTIKRNKTAHLFYNNFEYFN